MISRRDALRFAAFGMTATLGDAFALEPFFRIKVQHWPIAHPHWPLGQRSLTIAILSDIHAVEPFMSAQRLSTIVAKLNGEKPDVIVLLGDYVRALSKFPAKDVPLEDWTKALSGLSAPLGVYAVMGNHDWWAKRVPDIRRAFYNFGIQVLENRAVKIKTPDYSFWMAGLDDQLAHLKERRRNFGRDDLPGTLSQITDEDPVVLLAHEPDIFPTVPDRITVTLSGHTHGGQVYIPLIGRPVVPSKYGQRFAYGHIVENGKHLVVTAGVGLSVIPVRFLVPPEITLVTLGSPSVS